MMVFPPTNGKDRPRLRVRVAQEGASQWPNGVPQFLLLHQGGGPAKSIRVDGLVSPIQPALRIEFEPIEQIAAGEVRLEARLRVPENGRSGANWAKRFFEANCAGAEAVNYSVHLRFCWDDRQDEEWLNLIWDAKTLSLRDVPVESAT